jgi:hypothetical protein
MSINQLKKELKTNIEIIKKLNNKNKKKRENKLNEK